MFFLMLPKGFIAFSDKPLNAENWSVRLAITTDINFVQMYLWRVWFLFYVNN